MVKSRLLCAVASLLALSCASASGAQLTFDGAICNGGGACGNGSAIDQTYGDVLGQLDVVYDRQLGDATAPGTAGARLSFWFLNYSNLTNVAWGGQTDAVGTAEIFLQPLSGFQVTLLGLDLGAWPNTDRDSQLTILSGAGDLLFSSGPITVDGITASSFPFDLTRSDGIRIQWGPSAFNAGIDNIEFNVTWPGGTAPEPPASALMLACFGLLCLFARRRQVTIGAEGRTTL